MAVKIKDGDFQFEQKFSAAPGDTISYTPINIATGEPYHLVPLKKFDPEIALEHSCLCQMEMDLRMAANAFKLMTKYSKADEYETRLAIFSYAVIAYCRVFNSRYGRATKGVDLAKFVGEEEIDKNRHDFLKMIRNKVIAHRDTNQYEVPESYIFFNNEKRTHIMGVGPMNFSLAGFGDEDALIVSEYVEKIANKTKQRINAFGKMITDMVARSDVDRL